MLSVETMLKAAYQMPIEYTTFGKPAKATFDYAADVVKEQAAERNIDITNFYMIGDNPLGDIVGSNQAGW